MGKFHDLMDKFYNSKPGAAVGLITFVGVPVVAAGLTIDSLCRGDYESVKFYVSGAITGGAAGSYKTLFKETKHCLRVLRNKDKNNPEPPSTEPN